MWQSLVFWDCMVRICTQFKGIARWTLLRGPDNSTEGGRVLADGFLQDWQWCFLPAGLAEGRGKVEEGTLRERLWWRWIQQRLWAGGSLLHLEEGCPLELQCPVSALLDLMFWWWVFPECGCSRLDVGLANQSPWFQGLHPAWGSRYWSFVWRSRTPWSCRHVCRRRRENHVGLCCQRLHHSRATHGLCRCQVQLSGMVVLLSTRYCCAYICISETCNSCNCLLLGRSFLFGWSWCTCGQQSYGPSLCCNILPRNCWWKPCRWS